MEKRTWADEVEHLQDETLETIAEEINAGLEEAADACEFWTHKGNGDPEPGDRVELAIAGNNTDTWDRPIRDALQKDPHCADWDDWSIREFAAQLRACAFGSTRGRKTSASADVEARLVSDE